MSLESAIGTLPEKLSDLLEVALDDFEQVTKLPNVRVHMSSWCYPYNGKCEVCLAGAIIASRIGVPSVLARAGRGEITPQDFGDQDTYDKLHALNHLRQGDICHAYARIYRHRQGPVFPSSCPRTVDVMHHDGSPGFIPEMRSLIHLLRSHGL